MTQFRKASDGAIDLNSVGQETSGEPALTGPTVSDLQAEVRDLKDTVKLLLNRPAPAAAPISEDLQSILKVILKREERVAKAEERNLEVERVKNEQRLRNMNLSKDEMLAPQKTCKHLKGGKKRKKNQAVDYAVYPHRFVDGTLRVRCTLCGAFWQEGDTKEFIYRRGKKLPNPTKLSWADACAMVEQSTNKYSCSEIRYDVLRKGETTKLEAENAELRKKLQSAVETAG